MISTRLFIIRLLSELLTILVSGCYNKKKGKIIKIKKVVEGRKIWDEKEEIARSEKKAKKLVLE